MPVVAGRHLVFPLYSSKFVLELGGTTFRHRQNWTGTEPEVGSYNIAAG